MAPVTVDPVTLQTEVHVMTAESGCEGTATLRVHTRAPVCGHGHVSTPASDARLACTVLHLNVERNDTISVVGRADHRAPAAGET